jgi:hypothetical protein
MTNEPLALLGENAPAWMILSPRGYVPLQSEYGPGGRRCPPRDEKAAAEKRRATWAAKRAAREGRAA